MKKTAVLALCAISAAALLTGCRQLEKINRVKPAEVSSFLEHPELMAKQEATFPFHYFYLKKDAGKFDNVCIAPVDIRHLRKNETWAKLDQKAAEQIGSDINKLADFTRNAFVQAFRNSPGNQNLRVVDNPNAAKGRTLLVRLAIVSIVPTKAELNILGTIANFVLPGIGIITGQVAGGSITMECVIEDAKTGQIIAMFANTEKDQKAILNLAGMTWYTSAEKNIEKQAESTAKVFSGCDYSYTRRHLIKLIEL